ncbi:NADH-quinone oxidoreductase subunit C [Streptomyces sp. WMMB 322]|uniref:NADH-quinone oxidoreductase subunit C n=1 Tax=Streptomyces sp. WMMB 322 TaxID=1286821 RepID=UPI0011130F68|nr:NADH-quinone oxidoreductase subunit C [Streptomyces sp. WMMB 322]
MPESATAPAGWLPDGAEALFGEGARAEEAYGLLTVDVPSASWIPALETVRDGLGCRFFDWLSAVHEPGTGFQVCAHVAALPDAERPGGPLRRLLLRTTVPHEAPELPTATGVFAGAAWHERETHEMFGVVFTGHPNLTPLLLPESFEGHPLRKDFVLAARVAKAWPGAVEPGESAHGAPKRRQMLPPGVPDPNEWGPLKGQLPPVPSRPARGRAGRAGAGERPARRARSASAGSASQRGAGETGATGPGATGSGATEPGAAGTGTQPGQPSEQHPDQAQDETRRQARDRASDGAPDGTQARDQAQDQAPDQARDRARDRAPDGTQVPSAEEKRTPGASGASPAPDAPWHDARPAPRDSGGGRDASDGDRDRDGGDAAGGSGDGQTEEGA